jgi:glycosyltransferase involved in cell wall biosynthesis
LIAGFARAAGQRDALLVIAGPDDEALTGELRRVAAAHQVDERVRFVGPVYGEDQLTALAAADVWALTSHTENFGNAVIEAMAAGRAVLVSTEVNLSAQIARAQAGIVTDLSIDAIAGQLRALLEDPGRRAELGVRARGFAARFDWSIIAPELVTAFTEIVQARRRG